MFGLVLDERFEGHDTGPGHPERPARLRAIRGALEPLMAPHWTRIEPRAATDAMLLAVHAREHLEDVAAACAHPTRVLDGGDTVVGPASERIARQAAGSIVEACRRVHAGEIRRAFAAVRPPGHHAERQRAMGFCLYNSVAVAAAWLRAMGVERVLVVDWDVHHGNGTQHIFEEDPTVFYFSVHQWPLYPGTGAAEERGRGAGEGFTLNRPLPPGAGDEEFLAALRDDLVGAAAWFRPEFVLVSAGFDAHRADPLAQLRVTTPAFGEATRIVRELAQRHAGGRVVSCLEGGYDLEALAACVEEHVRGLALEDP